MWCLPKIDGEYVARMSRSTRRARGVPRREPSSTDWRGARAHPAAPGQLERVDYEYRRNGTVNLFVAVDAHRPWRKVTVTEQRTARDYAKRLRELVDVDYRDACLAPRGSTDSRSGGWLETAEHKADHGESNDGGVANDALEGKLLAPRGAKPQRHHDLGRSQDRR
jgi:hypothetical protein